MPLFNREQYKEIEDAKERLRQFKDKIQPYPILPEEPREEKPQRVIYELRQSDRAMILGLQKKLIQHIEASKRKVNKYANYK